MRGARQPAASERLLLLEVAPALHLLRRSPRLRSARCTSRSLVIQGSTSWSQRPAPDVADLARDIIKELKLDVRRPSAVSLHLATAVDVETDEVKGISEKPLPPRKSLVDANVGNGACIVVKVAGATAGPGEPS